MLTTESHVGAARPDPLGAGGVIDAPPDAPATPNEAPPPPPRDPFTVSADVAQEIFGHYTDSPQGLFAGVRLRESDEAARFGVPAFTRGDEVVFAPGRLDPDSAGGRELIGHELTHVVQQRQGRASGIQGKGGSGDPALEEEADVAGAQAARGEEVDPGAAHRALLHADAVFVGNFRDALEVDDKLKIDGSAAVVIRSKFTQWKNARSQIPRSISTHRRSPMITHERKPAAARPEISTPDEGGESENVGLLSKAQFAALKPFSGEDDTEGPVLTDTVAHAALGGRALKGRADEESEPEIGSPPGMAPLPGQRAFVYGARAGQYGGDGPASSGGLPGRTTQARLDGELPREVRAKMEASFGADFSDVRVHQEAQAEVMGAEAFTQGSDIHFAPGRYDPYGPAGQELLGHELAHLVQQRQGRVEATVQTNGADVNDDPALEREADQLGARAADVAGNAHVDPAAAARGDRSEEGGGGISAPSSESVTLPKDAPAREPVQARRAAPIQMWKPKSRPTYIPYQIRIAREMTGEEFKLTAMRQVFGGVINSDWENTKDSYGPEDSPVTLLVDTRLVLGRRAEANDARGIDTDAEGRIAGAEARAQALHGGPPSEEKSALLAEIDRRYFETIGTSELIKKGEAGKAQLWLAIRDEVLFEHQYIGKLPPKVQQLIKASIKGRELTPADYDQLFRVAKKIDSMPAGQVNDYQSKITGSTTDLDEFEAALDRYSAEMAARAVESEGREAVQTKLLGLEEVYRKYQLYSDGPVSEAVLRDELENDLHRHGFASIAEFELFIERFKRAFEREAANIAKDLLAKYAGRLYRESERYRDPEEVSALHRKLGGMRAEWGKFEKNWEIWTDYNEQSRHRPPHNGPPQTKVTRAEAEEAHERALAAKAAAKAEVEGLAEEHPIFQEEGLPVDKRIQKAALATAKEDELGGLLQSHIAARQQDIAEARSEIEGDSEVIYKMDKLMPQFYKQQNIAPGSIYDLIIQDKMKEDATKEMIVGIVLAIVAIALTIVSMGAATPALVAAGAAAGAFGVSAYLAFDEYQEYTEENDLSAVGFADDPSVVWLVLAVVGAGLDMAAAFKIVKALGPAAKAVNEGGDLTDFVKAVDALEEAGEIDAKTANAADKAAASREESVEASKELDKALSGGARSFTDRDVFPELVNLAEARLAEGVDSVVVLVEDLNKARAAAGLGEMTPEELVKVKEAWDVALRRFWPASKRLAEFTDPDELAIAECLEARGKKVHKNPMEGVDGMGRQGDAYVDGVLHEFKKPDKGATSGTVKNEVNESIRRGGQAREIVIDARDSGLTEEAARTGAARALGISRGKLDGLTIIGDDYFFRWTPR